MFKIFIKNNLVSSVVSLEMALGINALMPGNNQTITFEDYIAAAKTGDVEKIKKGINMKIHLQDSKGDALYFALKRNNVSCVNYILDNTDIKILPKHYYAAGLSWKISDDFESSKKLYELIRDRK